ncbi:MAG: hypothetical protein ACC707_12320 [Thiohalomonadales bacterium]
MTGLLAEINIISNDKLNLATIPEDNNMAYTEATQPIAHRCDGGSSPGFGENQVGAVVSGISLQNSDDLLHGGPT